MRSINKIIIHCSATKEGRDFGASDIDVWHKAKGWKCIGYHYVIKLDGSIQEGRQEQEVGAHASGHNHDSIGICYIGGLDKHGKPKDTRTHEQKKALKHLIWDLKLKYPGVGIYGHRDFERHKDCPCFEVQEWLESLTNE